MKTKSFVLAAVAVVLVGCHTITEKMPTQPTNGTSGTSSGSVLTVPIPVIPTPKPAATPTPAPSPTPTPNPTPTPGASPTPGPGPTGTAKCGEPLPTISRINVKIHMSGPLRDTLDATPQVIDRDYCAAIGFYDGRSICPVRMEGAADRAACEEYAIGKAKDTMRAGPTWYRNGVLCDGTYCENHPENQYLLWANVAGFYEACSANGLCGSVEAGK